MSITAGMRLGPYEVIAPLGMGGMGEVFRARDVRLGRDVALKALRSDSLGNPERVQRFEREARVVGALNHPNVLAVFDVGVHEDSPYVVSELLEGQTLRERLAAGPLPARRAAEFAIQIAHGLAAAHEKGVIHRDLKPENLFLTLDGRLKILDFGLAKLEGALGIPTESDPGGFADTLPGAMLGTVGYMSPEQVRGQGADVRSDIFSFGAVLYEMVSGKRAFQGETQIDVLQAILRDEPKPLGELVSGMPQGLESVIGHCLEKASEQRYQSARDLAFQLELLVSAGTPSLAPGLSMPRWRPARIPRRTVLAVLGVLAVAGLVSASYMLGHGRAAPPLPTYRRLTYERGTVHSARFAPDGRTVIYSAAWNGAPVEMYSLRPGNPEARPMGMARSQLLSMSRADEMAVLQDPRDFTGFTRIGTLARLSYSGLAPRQVATNVLEADWTPSGELAVVRQESGVATLELPVGHVLYQTNGSITHMRVSPEGDLLAFIDHPVLGDDKGQISVVDREGKKRVLTPSFVSAQGLAWNGREIWFTADPSGVSRSLWGVELTGRMRPVTKIPEMLTLQDISRDGRVLFTREIIRNSIQVRAPGASVEQDRAWLDFSTPTGLSRDGRLLSFFESGEGGGTSYSTYVRGTDGSPAVRLSDGASGGVSPDGKWVVVEQNKGESKEEGKGENKGDSRLTLVPTGPGVPKQIQLPIEGVQRVWWASDEQLLIAGNEKGQEVRQFLYEIATGKLRAISPLGIANRMSSRPLSPDGKLLLAVQPGKGYALYPVGGADSGTPKPVPGLEEGEEPFDWSPDGSALLVLRRTEFPVRVYRVEISNGERSLWRELSPVDAAGAKGIHYLAVAPGADAYAYSFVRHLSDLYIAEGLR